MPGIQSAARVGAPGRELVSSGATGPVGLLGSAHPYLSITIPETVLSSTASHSLTLRALEDRQSNASTNTSAILGHLVPAGYRVYMSVEGEGVSGLSAPLVATIVYPSTGNMELDAQRAPLLMVGDKLTDNALYFANRCCCCRAKIVHLYAFAHCVPCR